MMWPWMLKRTYTAKQVADKVAMETAVCHMEGYSDGKEDSQVAIQELVSALKNFFEDSGSDLECRDIGDTEDPSYSAMGRKIPGCTCVWCTAQRVIEKYSKGE